MMSLPSWIYRTCARCSSTGRRIGRASSKSYAGVAANKKLCCVGIRREEHSVWERRAPLTPRHVQALVENGVRVLVEPSARRAFSMFEYTNVGAEEVDNLSTADIIMGVKVIPVESLIADKTYVFFSHTIKAQKDNMPLLDACLRKNIRILDYEMIKNSSAERTVYFGSFAGTAGMINILHGLGLRLLALGYNTPLLHVGRAHNYPSVSAAKAAIASLGQHIEFGVLPECLRPLIFVFTGTGNVSKGARDVFGQLPVEMVKPRDLPEVVLTGDHRRFYGTVVQRKDHLERIEGGGYNAVEYKKQPELYRSTFADKIAPYMSVLVNGIFYVPGEPRLLTVEDAKRLLPKRSRSMASPVGIPEVPHRLLAVADVSCDMGGSVQFMTQETTLDNMFSVYNPHLNHHIPGNYAHDGVMVMMVENQPAQLPRESSEFFGSLMLPYMHELVRTDWRVSFNHLELSSSLKDAIITYGGKLTPKFEYISDLRALRERRPDL